MSSFASNAPHLYAAFAQRSHELALVTYMREINSNPRKRASILNQFDVWKLQTVTLGRKTFNNCLFLKYKRRQKSSGDDSQSTWICNVFVLTGASALLFCRGACLRECLVTWVKTLYMKESVNATSCLQITKCKLLFHSLFLECHNFHWGNVRNTT